MAYTVKSRVVSKDYGRNGRIVKGAYGDVTSTSSSGGGGGSSTPSSVEWGFIDGTLSNQTDLQNALDLKLDTNITSLILESLKLGSGESGALVRDLMFTEDGASNGIGWYNTSLATSANIYRNSSSEFVIGARGGVEGNGIKIDVDGNLVAGLDTHILGGLTVENASLFKGDVAAPNFIANTNLEITSGSIKQLNASSLQFSVNTFNNIFSLGDEGLITLSNESYFDSQSIENNFKNIIKSKSYAGDQFDGYGWKVTPDDGNSNSLIVTDNLIVRKQFRVFEMQISRLEHIGAMMCLSAARGVVERFTSSGPSSFQLFFDTKGSNNPVQFIVDDIVYAQDYTGDSQGHFKGIVTAVNQPLGYINVTTQEGAPFVGMHLVQKGNPNDTDRQAMVFMNSLGTPYIRLWDDMTTGEFADGTLLASYGDLSDIVSPAHGQLNGTGLYAQNAYLENAYFSGVVKITGGNAETIDTNIYCRGTGFNNSTSRILKIGETTVYTASGRGLRLTVINRSSLAVVSDQTYDVYGIPSERTALADAMNSLSYDVFVVLTSHDAIAIDENLSSAIKNCGGSGLLFNGRNPYALIGIPGIGPGKGLETYRGTLPDQPYAEISTRCKNGMIEGMNVSVLGIANDNAQSYADNAEFNANNYSDTVSATAEANAKAYTDALENTLGAVAYENLIETSKLGTTVIEGGYLKTNLIDTDWIFAQQAIIGGWSIVGNVLSSGNIEIDSGNNRIRHNGGLWSLNNDGSFVLNNGNFYVDSSGNLTALNADLEGTITASSGEIGGFDIGLTYFQTSNYNTSGANGRMRISSNDGTIRVLGSNNEVSSISYQGILSNNAQTQFLPTTSGVTALASISGLGFGNLSRNLSTYHYNYLCGSYSTVDNSAVTPCPSYASLNIGPVCNIGGVIGNTYYRTTSLNFGFTASELLEANVWVINNTSSTTVDANLPLVSDMIEQLGNLSKTSFKLTVILYHGTTGGIRPRRYYHWNGAYSDAGEFTMAAGDTAEFIFVMTSRTSGYWQVTSRLS